MLTNEVESDHWLFLIKPPGLFTKPTLCSWQGTVAEFNDVNDHLGKVLQHMPITEEAYEALSEVEI
jgi:hypothetical protein